MAIFKGAGVAIVTPMYEDGKVNYDKLEELLEFQIANSTDAIIICGTTGESSTMTHGEHLKTIKFAIDKVNKRVPVIAGTGSNCTETAIMMSKEAASYGADALLVVTPYYNKATQKGLIAHYTAIANAVPETPIIMYNVPGRTVADMNNDTVLRLTQVPGIIGIKEATGNIERAQWLIRDLPKNFAVYSGDDPTAVALMLCGGHGNISVTANVAPRLMHELCVAAIAGDRRRAMDIQFQLLPVHKNLFVEANPIPVKWAMQRMGLCGGDLRLPLTPLSGSCHSVVESALQSTGLIG